MTSKTIAGLLLAALFSAQAVATDYLDSDGRVYGAREEADGVILKSGNVTIHLGRTCKASSRQYGNGNWVWANGGFIITFPGRSIRFPRQELDLDDNNACRA